MTPDDYFTLGKTLIMVVVVLMAFAAWLHIKDVAR